MAVSLDLAISAIRSNRKEEGRQLLNLLIQQNPNDENAWLWMSSVVNTDEQRARCLYHVLAINPTSDIARRGLQVLGIVVSDSRPVKIPRDSRPIKIPKPSVRPTLQTFVPIDPQPELSTTAPPQPIPPAQPIETPKERRPFLIDPKTVTEELPFTPLKAPFSEIATETPTVINQDAENNPAQIAQPQQLIPTPISTLPDQTASPLEQTLASNDELQTSEPLARLSDSQPVAPISSDQTLTDPTASSITDMPSKPVPVTTLKDTQELVSATDSQPVPVIQQAYPSEPVQNLNQHPSEPLPVIYPDMPPYDMGQPIPPAQHPSQPGPIVTSPAPNPVSQAGNGSMDMMGHAVPLPGQFSPPEGGGLPAQNSPANSQAYYPYPTATYQHPSGYMPPVPPPNNTRPSQPMPVIYHNQPYPASPSGPAYHASPTMGMPVPLPAQPAPTIHSNTTMGMPVPAPHYSGQHPSEPVPVVHSNNMAMYGQAQQPQNVALHSSSTMLMPTMSETEARARLATNAAIPTGNATAMVLQNASNSQVGQPLNQDYDLYENEEEEEEINILAVIIFGTLSVTALGGLGMLIILVFTAPV